MDVQNTDLSQAINDHQRERLLFILSAATFLIFFQAYMVAPLIPKLAEIFQVSSQKIGLVVPAYMIPYGVSTLFFGILPDRIGRKKIMIFSFIGFIVLTFLTVFSFNVKQFILLRFITGLVASGIVPLSLSLIGQLYSFETRGRPLGWLFGAMAGGMAFGSTLGAIVEPLIGWQGLFGLTSLISLIVFFIFFPFRNFLGEAGGTSEMSFVNFFNSYKSLISDKRGKRTYSYVFFNAVFHSGVFTWLGYYFKHVYNLTEPQIGLALLGYGVPGLLFGPMIGKLADRYGRRWLIPIGLAIAALSAFLLGVRLPVVVSTLAVTTLSLGYDMTQPLLAGIVTAIGGKKPGQAMGLNVFLLFLGFGVGSALFGSILSMGLVSALILFAIFQTILFLISIQIFQSEVKNNKLNH